MRTVTISMEENKIVVEYWRGDTLREVKKYDGMTTAFRFDVCNWLEDGRME